MRIKALNTNNYNAHIGYAHNENLFVSFFKKKTETLFFDWTISPTSTPSSLQMNKKRFVYKHRNTHPIANFFFFSLLFTKAWAYVIKLMKTRFSFVLFTHSEIIIMNSTQKKTVYSTAHTARDTLEKIERERIKHSEKRNSKRSRQNHWVATSLVENCAARAIVIFCEIEKSWTWKKSVSRMLKHEVDFGFGVSIYMNTIQHTVFLALATLVLSSSLALSRVRSLSRSASSCTSSAHHITHHTPHSTYRHVLYWPILFSFSFSFDVRLCVLYVTVRLYGYGYSYGYDSGYCQCASLLLLLWL